LTAILYDPNEITGQQQELANRIRGILQSLPGLRFREERFGNTGNGPGYAFVIETTMMPPSDVALELYQGALYVTIDTAEARLEAWGDFESWADMCDSAMRGLLINDLRVMLYREAGTPRAIWFPAPGEGAWNGAGGPTFNENRERVVTWKNWHGGLGEVEPH